MNTLILSYVDNAVTLDKTMLQSIGTSFHNIVTNLMRTVTSKRELWPKKPIFLHKKTSKSTPKSKSGATDSTIFLNGVKITTFFKHGLQNLDNSSEKTLKSPTKSKSDVT